MAVSNVMPSGSQPPEPEIPKTMPVGKEADVETPQPTPGEGKGGEAPLILGKYKTQDDLVKAHTDLQSKLGEQGNRIGSLEKQVELANQLLTKKSETGSPAQAGDRMAEIDRKLNEVEEKANVGDLTSGEAAKQAALLAAEKATLISQKQFQEAMKSQQIDKMHTDFKAQHPDFQQLVDSGELEKLKPGTMHDNYSAYFAYKVNQAQQEGKVAADNAYKKGMDEGTKLKAGVAPAGRVLSKPGETVRQANKQPEAPLSSNDLSAGMLSVLQNARGGGSP